MISKKFLRRSLLRNDFLHNQIPQQKILEQLYSSRVLPEFCDSTSILNWLASFRIFHSCTILAYSIGHTEFLFHLGRFQHCNLDEFAWRTQVQTGSRGFYFLCCGILQRNFANFDMEILALPSAKSFRGLYFS